MLMRLLDRGAGDDEDWISCFEELFSVSQSVSQSICHCVWRGPSVGFECCFAVVAVMCSRK